MVFLRLKVFAIITFKIIGLMFKVELFSEASVMQLQDTVNRWLSSHKEITIIHSNQHIAVGNASEKEYTFYILYTTTEAQTEALKELAAEVKPENSVEATEINPQVLKPTS